MWLGSINGTGPKLARGVYVAPTATVIGDVTVGEDASIWFGSVVRGDIHWVRIGARCNLQDGAIVHVERGQWPTVLEDDVSVGHAAVIHGSTLRRGCLVGISAVVLNGAEVGEGALVAAGAVVREGFVVPPGTLVAGVPATVRRELTAQERQRIAATSESYVLYAQQMQDPTRSEVQRVATVEEST